MHKPIYHTTNYFLKFIISYGRKWVVFGGLFVLMYVFAIKLQIFNSNFSAEQIIFLLFGTQYPIKDYSQFLLPYFWLIIHLTALLIIFSSIVEVLEKKSFMLLIRIKSRERLAFAMFFSVIVSSAIYTLAFMLTVSIGVFSPIFFSIFCVKYFILLWLTIALINLLSLLIYFLGGNSIVSLLISALALSVASLAKYKETPLKSSLILSDNGNYFVSGQHMIIAVLTNIVLFVLIGFIITKLIKKHSF